MLSHDQKFFDKADIDKAVRAARKAFEIGIEY